MKKGTRRIPLTQGKFAIVDACDYDWLMQWRWHALKCGEKSKLWYAKRASPRPEHKVIYMHREIAKQAGLPTSATLDHINRDGLNNTRENLRPCTPSQNCANKIKSTGFSSTYKGVHWQTQYRRWRAQIKCLGEYFNLGSFKSEYQAHLAYAEAAEILFGQFARK